MENQPQHQRWYDQNSTIAESIAYMNGFPIDFQIILGEMIIELAVSKCNAEKMLTELRSLGPEKVLSIFKSKSKRRTSDAHQEIHQAMNYMYILPDGERIYIAKHLRAIMVYFNEYFRVCREGGVQPSTNIAREVGKAYLRGDLQDPNIFLAIVRQQIQLSTHYSFQHPNLALNKSGEEAPAVFDEKVALDGSQGMKIRLDKID